MNRCKLICNTLMKALSDNSMSIKLHSVFQNAVNFSTPTGLVTVLPPEKGLQPYSAVLNTSFSFGKLQDSALSISKAGIAQSGRIIFSFENAEQKDLFLNHKPRWRKETEMHLLQFLAGHMEKGLVEMAFGRKTNIFSEFLFPKVEELRKAVRKGEEAEIVQAVWQMAGCGIGLTPSSDDFLCGYLMGMPDLGIPDLARHMMEAASSRTNDISAALLRRAGDGLFSYDILQLVACLEKEGPQGNLEDALMNVAEFGSSSGCDFLTGMYFGIKDYYENGGIKR